MIEEKAALGIQKLLSAEQKAAEVVSAARTEKVAKLKEAKVKAEEEITAYKVQREAQFAIFSKERLGDSGSHKSSVDRDTIQELNKIDRQTAANKDTMVHMLLQSVTTVG
eukprot:CAMPEP_0183331152 /NCGR_PEP_ID=MMETSP0164_2-20130417/546_1 /TAXON_ID=221442 /ORGANISM="Coccolithus pelagicus ssp braarudi, Strain PLY182g" /LENGTH=109 /DNA_ID=CAMNT_0025499547 /DNA_START=162 /DNA_END=491 /DNA_ORIENTATION=+